MKRKYKSGPLEALHETVSGLHKIGLMTDEEKRFYDEGCLVPRVASQKPVDTAAHSGAPVFARGK
jgi:DNA-binding transcriptional regulator YiaG